MGENVLALFSQAQRIIRLATAGAAYAAPAVPLKKSIASMDEQVV